MTRWFGLFLIVGTVAAGYFLLQTPQGQKLLRSRPERTEDPLAFLEEKSKSFPYKEPDQPADAKTEPQLPSRPASQARLPETGTEKTGPMASQPAVPNEEVSRVLFGILRARNLASGISLSVSNDTLGVIGAVDSMDKKRQIIEILEKGRGIRRLDASLLEVQAQ